MKTIRLRYTVLEELLNDLKSLFPYWDEINDNLTDDVENKHAYVKHYYNTLTGIKTHTDVYLLVEELYEMPIAIIGSEITDEPADHFFMGHESNHT